MQIYQTVHRGYLHKEFCEDFCTTFVVQKHFFVGIVSDGCSSGKDSHFASALSVKLLRKIVCQTDFSLGNAMQITIKNILNQFIQELKRVGEELQLDDLELLATVLLVFYDSQTKISYVLSLGDGVIVIDDTVHEIDHDNMPNYPIYHKHEDVANLEQYFFAHYFEITNAKNIAIATDGVMAFQPERREDSQMEINVANFLLIDSSFAKNNNMLQRKMNILRTQHNLIPSDDVAVVRFIFE
jgi:hypothetical protein